MPLPTSWGVACVKTLQVCSWLNIKRDVLMLLFHYKKASVWKFLGVPLSVHGGLLGRSQWHLWGRSCFYRMMPPQWLLFIIMDMLYSQVVVKHHVSIVRKRWNLNVKIGKQWIIKRNVFKRSKLGRRQKENEIISCRFYPDWRPLMVSAKPTTKSEKGNKDKREEIKFLWDFSVNGDNVGKKF